MVGPLVFNITTEQTLKQSWFKLVLQGQGTKSKGKDKHRTPDNCGVVHLPLQFR